jgi:predicted nucleic acid-binding protein
VSLFLADTSAWHRSGQVPDRWSALLDDDELVLCEPVALEILYSARGGAEFREIAEEIEGIRMLSLDSRAVAAARRAQAKLAERGQHRGPKPVDLLIAGVAESHRAVLLHYDRHFDAIARVTGQPAEWLAKRGSLD